MVPKPGRSPRLRSSPLWLHEDDGVGRGDGTIEAGETGEVPPSPGIVADGDSRVNRIANLLTIRLLVVTLPLDSILGRCP
jgi:hypothetical protein